jgi:hypothetical protein
MNTRLVSTLLLCTILLVTNRWLSFQEGLDIAKAADTISYMAIAKAAPALPSEMFAQNHTMRLVPSWIVGTVAHGIGISEERMFLLLTVLVCAAIVAVVHRLLQHIGLHDAQYTLCMALVVLNPYTFRYYLAVPAMVADMVFVLGLASVLLGLLRVQPVVVLAGGIVAAIGRQNALVFLPAVLLWLWVGNGWKERSTVQRGLWSMAYLAAVMVPYSMISSIVAPFSQKTSMEAKALTGIFLWLGSDAPHKATMLAEYMVRMNICLVFPVFITFALFLAKRGAFTTFTAFVQNLPREMWLALLVFAALYGFALLGGPEEYMTGVTRYVSHAFLALIIVFAVILRQVGAVQHIRTTVAVVVGLCVVAGSLHHLTTIIGSNSDKASVFAVLHAAMALFAAITLYGSERRAQQP